MKKLVSMLLIVGIIASLFTCMTVSADDTAVTGNAPLAMLDFSVKGSAAAAISAGNVILAYSGQAPIGERSDAYGGPGLEINATTTANTKWAQAGFKFDNFDKSLKKRDTYLKVAYMLSNVADAGYNPGVLKAGWYWIEYNTNGGVKKYTDSDVTWTPTTLPKDYVWKTAVIKIPACYYEYNDNWNDAIRLNFNGLTCKATIKYMALFDSKADAENYDPSISGATIQDAPAYVDHYNHTATVTLADGLDESAIPDFSADDVALTLYNSTKYADQQGGAAEAEDALALTKATALSDKATYGKTYGYNYKEIQYKVSGTGMTDTIWSVRIQSKNSSYIEPLELIDFTNPANLGKLEDPDGGNGKRLTGTAKVGNTNAAYFARKETPSDWTSGNVLDNWHYVRYDTQKVSRANDVYMKLIYRFGDDAEPVTDTSVQKQLHIYCPDSTIIGKFGNDNISTRSKAWSEAVVKIPASTTLDLKLGTFNIFGKVLIKYIAFFDNEEDAKNYKFGDIGATITTDGTTVNAIYDNAEVAPNGARVLALYQGDQLKKVVYSADMDEISATGLEAGTYTAKAFCWNSLDEGYPKFDGTEAAVTVN